MSADSPLSFADALIAWQRRCGRHDLPWQQDADPYRVWVSEIMLQQTQVVTVIPYFERFMQRFPNVQSLAEAPLDEVLGLWSGLGYYARGRNLHKAAQQLMREFAGQFPADQQQLMTLPGIGRSTAAAIAAFCFGQRTAICDGNVRRVLARYAGIAGYYGEAAVGERFWTLAESLLPQASVDIYTQAIMDLGATVCTRSQPRCGVCPVQGACVALREGRVAELPTPKPRKALPEKLSRILLAHDGPWVLLERRPAEGLWGGLWSLPEIPADLDAAAFAACLPGLRLMPVQGGYGDVVPSSPQSQEAEALVGLRHTFSHYHVFLEPWRVAVRRVPGCAEAGPWVWVAAHELTEAPLPAPVRRILQEQWQPLFA